MPSARHWHGGLLVAAWIVTALVFFVLKWGLERGVYEARIEGQRVELVSGLWTTGFASAVTWGLGALAVGVVAWLTGTWIAGIRDRARLESMTESPYRRPLM